MVINFALAGLLVAVTAYTDATRGKIYNRHTLPALGLGLVLAVLQHRQDLILSAVLVFGFYYFIYRFPGLISRMGAKLVGALPLPEGTRPWAGGDVKLAAALAVLIGHMPVLYGTALASLLLLLYHGMKAWVSTGSAMALVLMATGKGGYTSAPFGPFLGPCCLLTAALIR